MPKDSVKYSKCVVCNRYSPIKFGEYTNDGFKCSRHSKLKLSLVMKPIKCKKCSRTVIPDLVTDELCPLCYDSNPMMTKKIGIGSNWGEHMSKKRQRLSKRHKHR